MKLKSQTLIVLAGFIAFSAMSEQLTKPDTVPSGPPDKEKVSYAQGMRVALIAKQIGADVDLNQAVLGLQDTLAGKPAEIPESEIAQLFRQAEAWQKAKQAEKAKDGDDKNAAPQGIPSAPPDKVKFGYAVGRRAGLYLKATGRELDPGVVVQAFKDVMAGKPTRIPESETGAVLRQAHEFALAQQGQPNKAAGDAFLAKNVKAPGITVLPDGLQYRVLQSGTGAIPTTNDLLFVNYRGSFLDGNEFTRHNHFLTRSDGGPKGWQEALPRMKVGSKWQLFMPPDLAFGLEGDPFQKVGPLTTVIYELELLSIAQPGDPDIGTGRMGHGLDGQSQPGS
jgi:FKBP-type peptidyl-prolyl cis-trans isomerase